MTKDVDKVAKPREEWIDMLRALAMFLVVVGHVSGNKVFYTIFNPIKMPMFYILSGYFCNLSKKPGKYITDILYRLIIPWLVFSLLPVHLLKYAIQGDWAELLTYAEDFFLGYKQWFITSFIITQLVVYILYHLFKKKDFLVSIGCIILFLVGYFVREMPIFQVWAMDTALTGTLFLFTGILLHKYRDKWIEYARNYVWLCISLIVYIGLVALSFLIYPGESMDFHNVYYYNLIICILLIFTGTFVCICVAMKISHNVITKYICLFGQNTLVVYLMHNFWAGKIKSVVIRVPVLDSFVGCVFVAVLTCALCTIISVACGRFFPVLIGKKRSKTEGI